MFWVFTTVKSMAEETKYYIPVPAANELTAQDVTSLQTQWVYLDIDDIKVLIEAQNNNDTDTLNKFITQLLHAEKMLPVEYSSFHVIFIEEYNGYWIFQIL